MVGGSGGSPSGPFIYTPTMPFAFDNVHKAHAPHTRFSRMSSRPQHDAARPLVPRPFAPCDGA